MFKIFANAWRVQDIRRKILFILLLLFIYRIGSVVPLPGIDLELLYVIRFTGDGPGTVGNTIFSLIMGGGFASVFFMGIAPYITASIIMQLLTYAVPALQKMQKEDGEEGRKKIGQITRYLAVIMAAIQAAGMVFSYTRFQGTELNLFYYQNLLVYIVAAVAMMTGTIFIMWLAELLTEKGIGSGASFLIFANILAGLPNGALALWHLARRNDSSFLNPTGSITAIAILIVFALIIAFVVLVHEGERRIPVQYAKKAAGGRSNFGGNHSSFIPLKVNIAGVMSIIFAMSLLHFPAQVHAFVGGEALGTVVRWLNFTSQGGPIHWFGVIMYVIMIFMFTHFYTSFAVNPVEMAENMKKNGGFIPGIRPGRPTSDYIAATVKRLSWIGAVFYSLIALTPIVMDIFAPISVGFGGTTILIVIGVALEFVKQLESQLVMRNYKGFIS